MSAIRLAMTVQLRPEKVDEYIANHKAVWPEVEARFHLVGITELSVFLRGEQVVLYVKYEGAVPFDEALATYADDEVIQQWEALNARCKMPQDGATATGFQVLEEIYRYEQ